MNFRNIEKLSIIFLSFLLLWNTTSLCGFSYSKVRLFQSSKSGDNLAQKSPPVLLNSIDSALPSIMIYPDSTFQKITGFGGSFTESVAYVLNQLDPRQQSEILEAYFSPGAAGYSLTRTHINSCDFSLKNYSYADSAGDLNLRHFSIQEDLDDLIPLIKDAMAVTDADFRIIASPWTAPPWMKDNNSWNGGSLKPEYYESWALYFSKYIQAYAEQGIEVWAVTVENEPLGNGGQWESMIYSPQTMTDFIKNYLGPQFRRDRISSRILIYDQNRDEAEKWASEILSDREAAQFVWGTAVHWYSSTVNWYPDVLSSIHRQFPDKQLLHTEGCIDSEIPVWKNDPWYWSREATDWGYDWAPEKDKPLHPPYVPVYRYARDIIGGLNSWFTGWIDWNLVLDTRGGPNHASNWCIAPVIVNTESREVYYTPLYYIMCHFSRFIRPGAFRIGIHSDRNDLMATACSNPDGSVIVEVLNQTDERVYYQIGLESHSIKLVIPENSLQTILFEK
jgi:glucosylceramidase